MSRIACIDLGNTRVHCALIENTDATNVIHIPVEAFREDLPQWLAANEFDGVAFCSVVPQHMEVLAEIAQLSGQSVHHLTHTTAPGLKINYPKPAEIGQDRLADAIAAQLLIGDSTLILDAGTAVTVDLVDKDKGYLGGLIAPGLAIMSDYLHEKTAKLPKIALEDIRDDMPFGQSTASSMALACAVGFTGMVEALTKRALDEFQKNGCSSPHLLATGGSITRLLNKTDAWQIEPNLTLIGLAEAWRRVN